MMSWPYGLLSIALTLTLIQKHIDPSKITLAEIDITIIFVGMMIVSAIEDSHR